MHDKDVRLVEESQPSLLREILVTAVFEVVLYLVTASKLSTIANVVLIVVTVPLLVLMVRRVEQRFLDWHSRPLWRLREALGETRLELEALARYRASDPRIIVKEVVAHDYVPYRISVTARVENPGEPTVLRSWGISVARGTGEEVPGRAVNPMGSADAWVCVSWEPTKDGSQGRVDNANTPIRSGGTGDATLHFDFAEPLFALRLNQETCFTVSCRTIKNVRVQGSATRAPSKPDQWSLEDVRTIDRALGLTHDPARTNPERLEVARASFDELVEAAAAEDKEARKRLFGMGWYFIQLSLRCHGMMAEYSRDFDHFRDGCIRGGVRKAGYPGDG